MTLEIDQNLAAGGLIFLIFLSRVIAVNGGLKISVWRAIGKKGFIATIRQPDQSARRELHAWTDLEVHSLPRFKAKDGKDYFAGGASETVRLYGMAQWVYNFNDSRPLPLEQVQTTTVEVEEKVKNPDGTEKTVKTQKPVVVAGKPIDPMLIHAGFENKSIEAFNKLSDKPKKFTWGMFGLAIFLIIILGIISVYYTYYFGVNTACAVHAHGVACG